jgi:hypothetical protein
LFVLGKLKVLEGFFFAGQRTELILTRNVPPSDSIDGPGEIETGKLRILVALSTPDGEGNIDTQEVRNLIEQIRQMETKPDLQLLDGEKCTTDQFTSLMTEFKPHIVHFIGHGKAGEVAFIKEKTDPDFDERTTKQLQARWIKAEQLGGMIGNCRPRPRLVFLHACKGAASTSNEAFNNCARALVYAHVPAVVAMQYNISNNDAALFAKTFYGLLGHGRDIDEAVKAGRLALGKTYPMWEHPRFATPVVYQQTNSPIVQWAPESPEKGDETAGATAASSSRIGPATAGQVPRSSEAPTPAADEPGRKQFGG